MIDLAFLEQLAAARSDMEFKRAAVGHAAMQLYDSVKSRGYHPAEHGPLSDCVREDLSGIKSETEIHKALESLVGVLPIWDAEGAVRVSRQMAYTSLLMYARALGNQGEWTLVKSVCTVLAMDAQFDFYRSIAAEATLMVGRASRMCADWEDSRRAYTRAYELGMESGNFSIAIRARIGEANGLWNRGDIPAAKKLLDATERRARDLCPDVLPDVILAIAGVANAAGEYERAIHLTFRLLNTLSGHDRMRYKVLVDLATFLADYGLPDVADNALRIVERSAPEAWIRVHARLNLFFLAAQHGNGEAFDTFRSALVKDPLNPREQTQYALFSAQGFRKFGQLGDALDSVHEAIRLSNKFEFFQLMFEAEAELEVIEAARAQSDAADATATRYLDHGTNAHGRATGGSCDKSDAAETFKPDRRDKIPPRIRRIATSLKRMELAAVGWDLT